MWAPCKPDGWTLNHGGSARASDEMDGSDLGQVNRQEEVKTRSVFAARTI